MPQKKVSFNAKPKQEKPINVDEWVVNRDLKAVDSKSQLEEAAIFLRQSPAEGDPSAGLSRKMKRLTLDIPESLHRAIKKKAVEDGETMADQLRSLLEKHYGN
jgi:predicted DNA binding CopG/RHH family protein